MSPCNSGLKHNPFLHDPLIAIKQIPSEFICNIRLAGSPAWDPRARDDVELCTIVTEKNLQPISV